MTIVVEVDDQADRREYVKQFGGIERAVAIADEQARIAEHVQVPVQSQVGDHHVEY